MLLGQQIADIPIVAASIDPCMSCTNRVTIVQNNQPNEDRSRGAPSVKHRKDTEDALLRYTMIPQLIVQMFKKPFTNKHPKKYIPSSSTNFLKGIENVESDDEPADWYAREFPWKNSL